MSVLWSGARGFGQRPLRVVLCLRWLAVFSATMTLVACGSGSASEPNLAGSMEAEGAGDSRRATIGIGGALAASPVAAEPDLASLSPNREARQATAASDDREVSDESSTLDSDATRRPASTGVPTAGSGCAA